MNFYNENDPRAAAWLRELIKEKLIAPGVVDERSIAEIKPHELIDYRQCHFFAGIGGWSLALRLAGWSDECAAWTGSCPCQPFSVAGKGRGTDDIRHLWPVFRELIRQCRPATVFGEQVASAAGRQWLAGVCVDVEGMGYAAAGADLCAAGVGAPHIRQRLYWVAQSECPAGKSRRVADKSGEGIGAGAIGASSEFGRSGVSGRMDDSASARRARALENAEGKTRDETRLRVPREPGAVGGLGDADESGPQGRILGRDSASERFARASGLGSWKKFDLLACADGKARRVESGTFPLAHGVPGRVGLLRGYGNAIVPQLAAEFIQAAIEAITSKGAVE